MAKENWGTLEYDDPQIKHMMKSKHQWPDDDEKLESLEYYLKRFPKGTAKRKRALAFIDLSYMGENYDIHETYKEPMIKHVLSDLLFAETSKFSYALDDASFSYALNGGQNRD